MNLKRLHTERQVQNPNDKYVPDAREIPNPKRDLLPATGSDGFDVFGILEFGFVLSFEFWILSLVVKISFGF